MKKTYNVLIIEDHQLIISHFVDALNVSEENIGNIKFYVSQAKNCDEGYKIAKEYLKNELLDLMFLDIQLPASKDKKILSGESLGQKIKELHPKIKIIVCTHLNDNFRLNNIFRTINPDGFLVKSDIDFSDIVEAIKRVLSNDSYYSKTIRGLLRKKASIDIILDEIDIKILYEISNGARMKELIDVIPLTKTGIEKRKRLLKQALKIDSNSDRDLIVKAKDMSFI